MNEFTEILKPSSLKEANTPAEFELYDAVNSNNLEMVKAIINANTGMSLDFIIPASYNENTPLLNALSLEYMEIAHYLLDNRASPWVTNDLNLSGLHLLAMVSHEITPKKEKQILDFLKKMMKDKKQFKRELNRAAPEADPKTPLALSKEYQGDRFSKMLV